MRFAILALLALPAAFASGFSGLCNTGVSGTCTSPTGAGSLGVAPIGTEQHWILTNGTAVIPSSPPIGPWLANDAFSQWISPTDSTFTTGGANYTYTLQFMVGALADLSTARINGRYASDNGTIDVKLNGVTVAGFPYNDPTGAPAFNSWTGFGINSGFLIGTNTITWTVANGGSFNPSGLRVQFFESNVADVNQAPEPSSLLLGGLGLVGLGIARRRRKNASERR